MGKRTSYDHFPPKIVQQVTITAPQKIPAGRSPAYRITLEVKNYTFKLPFTHSSPLESETTTLPSILPCVRALRFRNVRQMVPLWSSNGSVLCVQIFDDATVCLVRIEK